METTSERSQTRRPEGLCHRCGAGIALPPRLFLGEVVECAACRAQLEVVSFDPPRLEPRARVEAVDDDDFVGF